MSIILQRTDSGNIDFISLVAKLDKELNHHFGEEQAFFNQFNKLDVIKHVVVAYEGKIPVGCGAIKRFDDSTMEVKRMFVEDQQRGKGIASKVLQELELWSQELNYSFCVLETGDRLHEAVALYKKNGYTVIPNYGQYADVESSICFKKALSKKGANH